ncbi:hypothetical protein G5C66_11480 [Nocardioides sp. KC13]|uniref:Uncharacterized protein n=1 Tax=Nocardioides turkmenicus TaxID=2711220 RepID=A0A6M1R737_9ACTN|nr:hypothetical protein [Nocardioides sp. KC13]
MTTDEVEVSALAINVAIPDELQWTDSRREVTFRLTTLNVRLLPDGRLAAKAYGRPVDGGRGAYTSFPVPDRPELTGLIGEAAKVAAERWRSAYAPEHDAR